MIGRPNVENYNPYFKTYIDKVPGDDILLKMGDKTPLDIYKQISSEKWDYRYAEGKWSIKEVMVHILDTERIFAYRALRISRGDQTALPGFDQNDYVPSYRAASRSIESLLDEYTSTRQSSLKMFENFDHDHFTQVGTAGESRTSVLSLAFMIVGHEIHHLGLLKEKYHI